MLLFIACILYILTLYQRHSASARHAVCNYSFKVVTESLCDCPLSFVFAVLCPLETA